MARIRIDDYVDVDPQDYLDECNKREKQELFDLLIDDGFGDDPAIVNIISDSSRSESHRIFIKNIFSLKDAWYEISKEDTEIITILAKKYGAV